MIAYEFSMHRLFLAAPQQPRNPTSNKIIPKENIVKNDINKDVCQKYYIIGYYVMYYDLPAAIER